MIAKRSILYFIVIVLVALYCFQGEQEIGEIDRKGELLESNQAFQPDKGGALSEEHVSSLACNNFINKKKLDSTSISYGKESIANFLVALQHKGVNESLIDLIAEESGIGVFNARALRVGFDYGRNEFPYVAEQVLDEATQEEEILLYRNVTSQNWQKLLQDISSGALDLRHSFKGRFHKVSLLGYIIESDIQNKEQVITQVLALNPELIFSDLIVATRELLPISLIKAMHQQSNLDATALLSYSSFIESLSTLAIRSGSESLFNYWAEQSSSIFPDKFGYTALDILASKAELYEDDAFQRLLINMVEANIPVYSQKTELRFKKLLSAKQYEKYRSSLVYTEYLPSSSDAELIRKEVFNLFKIVLESYVFENLFEPENSECILVLGKKLTSAHFSKRFVKKAPLVKKEANGEQFIALNPIIQQAIAEYDSSMEVEGFLAGYGGLKGKKLIESYRYYLLEEFNKELRERTKENQEEVERAKITIQEVLELAKSGRWNEALSMLHELESSPDDSMSILLLLALSMEVDFEVIESLIHQGGILPNNAILSLIMKDDSELSSLLLPYGLNINFIDPIGYSSLMLAIKYKKIKMFNFLLMHGNMNSNEQYGLDALDVALAGYGANSSDTYYIKALIDNGVTVEQSHREKAHELKQTNFSAYIGLINISKKFLIDSN